MIWNLLLKLEKEKVMKLDKEKIERWCHLCIL